MCPDKARVLLTMRCAVNEKMNNHEEDIDPSSIKNMEKESRINGVKENLTSSSKELSSSEQVEYVPRIKWLDLSAQIFIHGGFLYGLYLVFTQAKLLTSLWAFIVIYTSGFGITAGVHRLWSHRAYKAKWPLRLLLVFLFTITGQKHVWAWVLDHRVHHKYSETDADPHNAKRGLYIPLFALLAIGLPVFVPYYFWSESLWISFWVSFNFRFCITLNIAFFVNSVAHMWGQKPYDKNISSVENIAVSIAALGEGWHNYHHVFPWDYKTGELGDYSFNITTGFIDAFARIGWAYDLKYVSPEMVRRRANKTGDGSHVWGYGDVDIPKEDQHELEMMDYKKDL
ncbi:hypothetical protein M0802_016403 [Mischocyttarus mexicanus]|nr:hypothetical protein M0802_016403 [Mischocyttarus mexicanus]